ncbi:MAG: AAA family ATPase [Rhodospirillales bacterium]|nr:AAA family ATPase [Rhodospirillales bacterium]
MRIERLALERYGHFSNYETDLGGDGVRLVVVLGRNEAGKTTALRALGDLLFGIEPRSPYNFRHDYKDMRIGAELRGSDGRRLTVRRRKGNQNTLLDAENRPLGDDALAPFLGGADRFVFDNLFGLTHEALRSGGDRMLAARGDLGRMLFEAGSSMRNITQVLDALEGEAAALFTPRRVSSKPFYVASDACNAAGRDGRQATLSFERWQQSERERIQAEAEQDGVRHRQDDLETKRARLERIRRTLPWVVQMRQVEAELAELADAPIMPADAGERLNRARPAFEVARDRLEREQAAAANALARLAALDIPEALLAAGDEIERLYQRRGAILEGRNELPALRERRDELQAEAVHLRAELACAESARPSETELAEVHELIARDSELGKQVGDVAERQEAAAAALAGIVGRLETLPPERNLGRLAMAVEQTQCLGDLDSRLADATTAAADAGAQLARSLAALALWAGDAAALEALALPERDTVGRFEREFSDTRMLAQGANDRMQKAEEERQQCLRELAALRHGRPLPTAEAVAAARGHRDLGWTLIRRLYMEREVVSEADVEAFAPQEHLAERYEKAVAAADALADRREAEAQRVARHDQVSADLDAAAERRRRFAEEAAQKEAALAALREEWRSIWRPAGIEPLPPREMELWLARRQEVLGDFEAVRATQRAVVETEARLTGARCDLEAELRAVQPSLRDGCGLTDLLKEAKALLKSGGEAAQRRAVLEEKRDLQKTTLDCEQSRRAALAERCKDWRAAWASALAPLGLSATLTPAAAAAAVRLWEDIRRNEVALAEVDRRSDRIARDGAAFAGEVERLVADALPGRPLTGDPLAATAEAFERLQVARQDARNKRDLEDVLHKAQAAAAQAQIEAEAARAELDHLKDVAGCASDDALAAAIDRSRRKQDQTVELARLKKEIVANAEGFGPEVAIAETEGRDPDEMLGEIAAIIHESEDLRAEAETLSERVATFRRRRDELEAGTAAMAAEQARRNALADLEDCSERWMAMKAAAFLLRRSIDQFRRERQGPVLGRAENLFSALTLGSFVRFRIDYDSADQPLLLGVRADGASCPVDGMSDGTRDQLFLALRLAAVESFLTNDEQLPFVADDLFVHFDDARATAGLKALIELGGKTQVLLFTHHHHLAELARQAGDSRAVRIQSLDRPALARPRFEAEMAID